MRNQPNTAARVREMPANADKQITVVVSISMPPLRRRGDFWPSTGLAHHVKAMHSANRSSPKASRTAPSSLSFVSHYCTARGRLSANGSAKSWYSAHIPSRRSLSDALHKFSVNGSYNSGF